MTRQNVLRGVLVLWLVLIPAGLAFGDTGTTMLYFVPGIGAIGLVAALPLTLVAAVLEWPFVSRAGIARYAFTRSLRANLLSWLVGVIVTFLFFAGPGPILLAFAYSLLAIPISIVIEGRYYTAVLAREGGVLRWSWVIAANFFSTFSLNVVVLSPVLIRPDLLRKSGLIEGPPLWALAAMCLVLVVFALRPLREPLQVPAEASPLTAEAESPREDLPTP
jgi:hypothetical protein